MSGIIGRHRVVLGAHDNLADGVGCRRGGRSSHGHDDRRAVGRSRLSRRGAVRVHRLAWTVTDLRGDEAPRAADVDTALRLRTGDPLLVESIERRAS